MRIKGVSKAEIARVAKEVDCWPAWKRGGDDRVSLRPIGERYRSVVKTHAGDTIYVACFHGQSAFIAELLEEYPDARIVSALGEYDGLSGFDRIQPEMESLFLERFGPHNCQCEEAA